MRAGLVTLYLGLGSNLGDSVARLQQGVRELEKDGVAICRASSLYRGPYVGPGPGQPDYWNAAVEAQTRLAPLELLAVTQAVERRCGRRAPHGQPRSLDVDVLYYGGCRVVHPHLIVPHPRLAERRFVLEPLHELGMLASLGGEELVARLSRLRSRQTLERLSATLCLGDSSVSATA